MTLARDSYGDIHMHVTIDMIRRGRKNATTRAELRAYTGQNDRTNRQDIRELIDAGYVILSDSKTSGYWLPETYEEVMEYIEKLEQRGKSCMARAKSAKRLYRKRDQRALGFV